MRLRDVICATCTLLAATTHHAAAQVDESSPKRQLAGDRDDTDQRHAEVQRVAESMTFFCDVSGERKEVEIVSEPVLRYADAPRTDRDGGVWIIGNEGRPLGMMVVYSKSTFPAGRWIQAVTSFCPDNSLRGSSKDRTNWTPLKAGVEMNSFPGAPVPDADAAGRLRQMKALARRFTGHEFWPADSRHELRLLVQPLYRYEQPEKGILDGAVFALAHDTNPEVFVIIEAVEQDGAARWDYGIARFGFAELHVELDSEEVWMRDIIGSTAPSEPYWLFHLQF